MTVWHLASGYRYNAAFIFLLVLQWLAATGRIAVRVTVVKKFGWDDVAMLVTLLCSTVYCTLFLAVGHVSNGGVSFDHLPPGHLVSSINLTLTLLVSYIVASSALKVACGMLLRRVLVRRYQVWTIYASMATAVLYGIFFFFFILFQCGNPSQFHLKIIYGQCLSKEAIDGTTYTHSVLMAGIDLIFAILPVALLWRADMSTKSKVSVAAILSLGSMAVVATFIRLAYVHDLSKPTITFLETSQPIGLLSGLELAIGLICICICTYKPFFTRYFGSGNSYVYGGRTPPPQSPRALPSGQRPYSNYVPATTAEMRRTSSNGTPMWPLRDRKEVDVESDTTSPSSPMKHSI